MKSLLTGTVLLAVCLLAGCAQDMHTEHNDDCGCGAEARASVYTGDKVEKTNSGQLEIEDK